jgi:hypothetical protein
MDHYRRQKCRNLGKRDCCIGIVVRPLGAGVAKTEIVVYMFNHIRRCLVLRENVVVNVDGDWVVAYQAANEDRLRSAPAFAAWLENDYVPIAGGWQY